MTIIKYIPTLLFISYVIEIMTLKSFTYETGIFAFILGLTSFGFSFFDTRNDIKLMREELELYKVTNSNNIEELSVKVHETSSVLNAVKVQNKVTTRKF